jgi:D-glycero-beta-D-manno-heptose-7-phosphate kinase
MTRDRAAAILRAGARKKILIVGDLILDEFLWGKVDRISPEAPVPVVQVTGESWYPGGAANVARNLREFIGNVSIAGLTGDDNYGTRLRGLLVDEGVNVDGVVVDASRPTVVKTRIVAKHQQVVRVDRERTGAPSADVLRHVVGQLNSTDADAIIVSDYAKGLLQQDIADVLARTGKILTIDPSPHNPIEWRNATAIKPNRGEAARICGDAPPEQLGARLLERWNTQMVLLTLGEDGMMLFERDRKPYHTPTRAREVFDVSGAGDTAIAVFTLALTAGAAPEESAELANAASGVVVGKLGTAVVSPEELVEAMG